MNSGSATGFHALGTRRGLPRTRLSRACPCGSLFSTARFFITVFKTFAQLVTQQARLAKRPAAAHPSYIFLDYGAFAHGLLHVAQRLEAGGHQQNAGCIFVQAVHRRGLESRARIMGRKSGSQAVAVAGAGWVGRPAGLRKAQIAPSVPTSKGREGKEADEPAAEGVICSEMSGPLVKFSGALAAVPLLWAAIFKAKGGRRITSAL